MVNFQSGYVPPGVYVSSDTTGTVGAVGISDTVLCLIGNGVGYETYTEAISFAAGDAVVLTKQGVNLAEISVASLTGAPYVGGPGDTSHDYSTAASGSGHSTVTTLTRDNSGGTIPAGATVVVTYQFTDPSYYALNKFSDFASFQDIYGPPFDPTSGALLSPLSLAAQLAFQNGANVIYAVALSGTGSTAAQFQAAYGLTTPNFDINILVPLFETATDQSSATSLITSLSTFINSADADGYPMLSFVGLPGAFSGATPDAISSAIVNRRVVLFWPQSFLYYNPVTNTTIDLDGIYFAAAAAGFIANAPFNQGLTQQQITNIAGISATVQSTLTTANKNAWSAAGVSVAQIDRNGRLVIRHGVTTDFSAVQNREISIVREEDALFDLLQVSLNQAGLIGSPIISTTTLSVKGIIAQALETLLADNTIQGYTNLLVRQQQLPGGDPTVVEGTFQWQPTYPLNYITANFTIDLTTGVLSTDTASSSSSSSPTTTTTTTG